MRILLSFLFILSTALLAQENTYGFKTIGMEDGLSFRDVTGIVQDKNGMIWVGTRNGLNKYDGYTFEHFSDVGSDGHAILSHSRILALAIDTSGLIWIGTNDGLEVLNPNTLSVRNYLHKEIFKAPLQIKQVQHLKFLANGRKFIQSYSLRCYDLFYTTIELINGVFQQLKIRDEEQGITYEYIKEIFQDKEGNTWVRPSNANMIYQIDEQHQITDRIDLKMVFNNPNLDQFVVTTKEDFLQKKYSCNESKAQGLSACSVHDSTFISVSYEESKLAWSYREFYEFHLESQTIIKKKTGINALGVPAVGRFYDASGNLFYFKKNQLFVLKRNESEPKRLLTGLEHVNIVKAKLQSSDNTLWLGSSFGLSCLKEIKVPFRQLLKIKPDQNGLGNKIRVIHRNQQKLYVSVVSKGIVEVDLVTNKERLVVNYIPEFKPTDNYPTVNPLGLYVEGTDLWISDQYHQGILRYNLKSQQLSYLTIPNDSGGLGTCLYKDKQNRLWQGTTKGINRINSNQAIEPFKPSNKVDLRQYSITAFYELSADTLLVGTKHSGLFYINSKGEFLTWTNKAKGLSTNTIQSINQTNNFVWIGTPSGLNRIHKKTREIIVFTTNQGLTNNNVYSIVNVKDQLWCATDYGLSKLNEETLSFENFTEENGVTHNEFNNFAAYQVNDSIAYLGGQNGIMEISDKEVEAKLTPTTILLTELNKYNSSIGEIEKVPYLKGGVLDIYPDNPFFSFTFFTTNYFESDKITYHYQIEEIDQQWISLGRSNKLRLNRMEAGSYTLKVKAMLANGSWGEESLVIPIRVHQVFYKTFWFIVICALGFLSIIYLIYRQRIKQIQKVERLRLKIASDLHDDVSTQLTQISLKSELMKQNMYNEEEQKEELTKMSFNSRELVGKMSDIIWSVDSRKDKIEDLIDRMKDHLSELEEGSGIRFELNGGAVNTTQKLSTDIKRDLYLIFKEAINNIIKHSNATHAYVYLSEEGRFFRMEIKDNGKTTVPHKSNGQGLKNMEMRVNNMKGKLKVQSANGFSIQIQVPL